MKPITIGIDTSFAFGERSGTSVYINNLIKHLTKTDQINEYILYPFFFYHFNSNYHNFDPVLPPNFRIFGNKIPSKFMEWLWKKSRIPKRWYLPRVDVFHATTFTIPPVYMYKKLIVTIYDTTFYTHPQFHKVDTIHHCMNATKEAVKKADTIIAISENTKNDLVRYFDCPKDKIVVTPLAAESIFFKKVSKENKKINLNKYQLFKPFIFHLGSLEPRKNTLGLIKAYLLLPKQFQEKYDLVISGDEGWSNDSIMRLINQNKKEQHIRFLGYIPTEDLPTFYQSAMCFVYPSFYEGFGIPPLEAMASSCPVLTSNISSLPEVCKDSALYCNPFDIEDMSNNILRMLKQDNFINLEKLKINASKFKWEKTILNTLSIYKYAK